MSANYKLDIFEVLYAIDSQSSSYYSELTEPERAELEKNLFIINRWASGVKNADYEIQAHYVLAINEYVNKHFYTLHAHPKLLWELFCMSGYGESPKIYHTYIKKNKTIKTEGDKKARALSKLFPDKKQDEIIVMSHLYSLEELVTIAIDLGWDDKQINEL